MSYFSILCTSSNLQKYGSEKIVALLEMKNVMIWGLFRTSPKILDYSKPYFGQIQVRNF